jgi:membrane protein
VGIGVLLFTATNVLVTLHNTLNRIFDVNTTAEKGPGIWKMLYDRVISFTMLVTISFILLVSLVVETLISALGRFVAKWMGSWAAYMMAFDSILLHMAATTVLFAAFFRYLPDVNLKWKDIWIGALVTSGFFEAGKFLIGFIIGNSEVADLYDAAGSILVVMLWVYYASAILLFGATFTFTRAKRINDL